MLIGRDVECAVLDQLLDTAREGRSGSLVVRGDAGIGKSALLDYAVERAEDFTVVRALGVESEAELEFSGLLEVCRPILDRLSELPERQADTLRGALGLAPAEEAGRLAIGAATLSLLAAVTEGSPLLVVVDDAHSLDSASADALLFAGRRLEADRAALLFAAREGDRFEAAGIPALEVHGLGVDAAQALLARAGAASIGRETAERLVAGTGGNPLALIELPRLLRPAQLAGSEPITEPLPTGPSLERAFAARAAALPAESRSALVVGACSISGSLETILEALQGLGLDATALEPAEDAELVTLSEGRLAFRHSLVRSAVYHSARPADRRSAHRALAEALHDEREAEERAWHLASAALGQDELAASALEHAAVHARRRSGYAAAAAALDRAARLSLEDDARMRRFYAAAEAAWEAGDTDRAFALIGEPLERCTDSALRARILHLRHQMERMRGSVLEAHDGLVEAASLVTESDPSYAVSILFDAVEAALYGGKPAVALTTAERARALAPIDGSPEDVLAELLLCETLAYNGRLVGDVGERVTRAVASLERSAALRENPRYLARAAQNLGFIDDVGRAHAVSVRAVEVARAQGAIAALAYARETGAWNDLHAGHWPEAYAAAAEAYALARETGQASFRGYALCEMAWVDGVQGRETECRAKVAEALELADAHQLGLVRDWAECVLGLLELGLGELESAAERLTSASERVLEQGLFDRDSSPWGDLCEALVRLGRNEDAARAADALDTVGRRVTPLRTAPVTERCRGLLADEESFEIRFRESLHLHEQVTDDFSLARTRLCFGERLRRAGRRLDARLELRAALEAFERLEAGPWVERTRAELRATGEKLGRRAARTGDELTAQELQVAFQVAEGKTNREVGAALFLSPKTVEFHLARVYRKLDLSSRGELIRRFAEAGAAPELVGH